MARLSIRALFVSRPVKIVLTFIMSRAAFFAYYYSAATGGMCRENGGIMARDDWQNIGRPADRQLKGAPAE